MKKIPMYEKVVSIIIAQIKSGQLSPGDRLGAEQELAGYLGIGRSTVREGFRLLQEAGYIEIRNGVGSFIRKPPYFINNRLSQLRSTGTMIAEAGYHASNKNLWVKHVFPDNDVRKKLQLEPQEKIVMIKREQIAEDVIIAVGFNIFPERIVTGFFDQGIETGVFHDLLRKCGIFVKYAETQFMGLDPERMLDREAGELLSGPVLLMEQLHFDNRDIPVLFSFDYVRTDYMRLTLHRERINEE